MRERGRMRIAVLPMLSGVTFRGGYFFLPPLK